MSRVLFILFLTLSLLAQNMALYGQVSGTVITLEGTPLADAIVYALPETAMLKPPLTTHADSDGKFSFTGLPEGGIYLDASKDSEGYLYSLFSFYIMPGQHKPKVTVRAGQLLAGVVIQLGAKAAYLDLHIRTSDGRGLKGVSLDLFRPDLPGPSGKYGRSGPETRVAVPPVPFTLSVDPNGYQRWTYKDKNGSPYVNLKSGETLRLDIELKPEAAE